MIPSRPLRLAEIFSETLKIFGRSIGKILLLIAVFYLPTCYLINSSTDTFVHSFIQGAVNNGLTQESLDHERDQLKRAVLRENSQLLKELEEGNANQLQISDTTSIALDTSSATIYSTAQSDNNFSWTNYFTSNKDAFAGSIIVAIIGALLFFFSHSAVYAGLIDITAYEFEERKSSVSRILKDLFKRNFWKTLALYFVIFVGPEVAVDLLATGASVAGTGPEAAIKFFGLFFRVYLMARWSMAIPSAVNEEIGLFESLTRSWHLTTFQVLRTFGFFAVFFIGLLGLFSILFLGTSIGYLDGMNWFVTLMGSKGMSLQQFQQGAAPFFMWALTVFEVLYLITLLFTPIFNTVFYYDLRTRLDGPLSYSQE